MKFLKSFFTGLVILFLLGGCDLGAALPSAGALQSPVPLVLTSTFTPAVTNTLPASITPIPPPTRRATAEFATITAVPSLSPVPLLSYTPTLKPLGTPTLSGPPGPFQCRVLSTFPEFGTILRPQKEFAAIWKIVNVGNTAWQVDDVAFYFLNGTPFQGQKYQDKYIPYIINVGDQLNLRVPMKAPKEPGNYTALWGLKTKSKLIFFCHVSIFIVVE